MLETLVLTLSVEVIETSLQGVFLKRFYFLFVITWAWGLGVGGQELNSVHLNSVSQKRGEGQGIPVLQFQTLGAENFILWKSRSASMLPCLPSHTPPL